MAEQDYDHDDHTAELKKSREEAEMAAETLRLKGWDVYPEKVPLVGQWGYYCVSTWVSSDGVERSRAHSVRWNLYDRELQPLVIDCQQESDILSFVWKHAGHPGFDHFEYGNGDVGFVCYCRGKQGQSLVLRIGQELDETFSDETFELLWLYENAEPIDLP